MSTRAPIGMQRPRVTSVVGISDRVSMPRIGKLRLGEKKKTAAGKEFPSETDYFRVDPDALMAPEERELLIARFHEVYGERPQILRNTFFPSDLKEFVFPQGLEWWGRTENGPKKLCEGNGVEASRLDREAGVWVARPCCQAAECAEWNTGTKCKLMSRLRVFLPDVSVSGYFQVDTSSQVGTGNILDLINHLLTMFGRLTSIPLVLSREPKPITYEGKTTTHYVLVMRAPNVNLDEFRQIASRNQMQISADDVIEIDTDPDDVPEELVPQAVQESAPDPDLMKKITIGFDAIGTSTAQRASALHRYKGREPELLSEISRRIDAQNKAQEALL